MSDAHKTARRRHFENDPYAQVLLKDAADAFKANKTSKPFVWLLLQHLAWLNKDKTVAITNQLLGWYGISRETKRKALKDYESAGFIKVLKDGNRAVVVTLLGATVGDRIKKKRTAK
jgi:hypothetical protein